MKNKLFPSIVLLALILPSFAQSEKDANALRFVEAEALTSKANPAMTFTPAESFQYVGSAALTLKEIARAERYHWISMNGDRVEKLLILQFEGFLGGVEGQYNFGVPNADLSGSNYKFSPAPMNLGGVDFIHNTWALDYAANSRENPGMEGEATLALLEEKGFAVEDALIMSRFVQAFGDDNRHELIIFYLEPLSASDKSLSEFPDGEPPNENYDTYSNVVTARSLASFDIEFATP